MIHMCVVYMCHKNYDLRGINAFKRDSQGKPRKRIGVPRESREWVATAQWEGPRLGARSESGHIEVPQRSPY